MKLVLDTLMIFFGILAAAGLVALGEPSEAEAASSTTTTSLAVPAIAPR